MTLHGALDVRAADETSAEEKAKEKLRAEKVKIADFEVGDERINCVGKVGDDDDGEGAEFLCPLSQRPLPCRRRDGEVRN